MTGVVSGELQALVDDLAARLGRSVVIDDPGVRLLCASRHFGDEDAVRVSTVLQRIAAEEIIAFVLAQSPGRWPEPRMLDGSPALGLLPRWCAPLRHDGHLLGLLMVIDARATLTVDERGAVERCARAAGAQLRADRAAGDADRVRDESALRRLLGADAGARDAAREQLVRDRRLREGSPVVVTVLVTTPGTGTPAQVDSALRTAVGAADPGPSLSCADGDEVVLLQLGPPVDLAAQARRLHAALVGLLGAEARPVVGVGATADGLATGWVSAREARIAARAAQRAGLDVARWDALGAAAVLVQLPADVHPARAVTEPLRLLAEHEGGARLLTTLRCYLDHAGSVPRTSAALHLHRTSLHYRLGRIREITGLDLDDGRTRLLLHLGLTLDDLGFPTE